MNKDRLGKYVAFSLIGLALFFFGLVLIVTQRDTQDIMKTLPYVCIGAGCGIFGENLGISIKIYVLRKNPQAFKQAEIEEKDERNKAIGYMAKAKAYDMMLMVFGALLISFALAQVDLFVVLTLVLAYLFIVGVNIYYLCRYHKEM